MNLVERVLPRGTALHRLLFAPDPPELALEVREHALGLVRARVERGALRLQAAAAVRLAPGTVRLSLTEPNVADAAAFGAALASLLARCGGEGARRVALVLPDAVGRLRLFPVAELRAPSQAQVAELARFRLKKTLPYDVREARVAVALPAAGAGDGAADGVVAVVARGVVESYEQACADAGLWAGHVELCAVALARSLGRRPGTLLLINRDEGCSSLMLLRDGWPLLARTLDRDAVPEPAALVREARATCSFAAERLQTAPQQIVLREATGDAGFAAALSTALALPVESLAGPDGAPVGEGASLAGALAAFAEAV